MVVVTVVVVGVVVVVVGVVVVVVDVVVVVVVVVVVGGVVVVVVVVTCVVVDRCIRGGGWRFAADGDGLATRGAGGGGSAVGGGGSAVGGFTDDAVLGGSVAVVLSVALVSAIATPPTATSATAAARPNTNCGSRCQVRGSSIGPVAGTYFTGARAVVPSVS